jgi:hypothetical protein
MKRILLIENTPDDTYDFIRKILVKYNLYYALSYPYNFTEAMELINKINPCMVIINMAFPRSINPDQTMLELKDFLKDLDSTAIPILVISGCIFELSEYTNVSKILLTAIDAEEKVCNFIKNIIEKD